MSDDVTSNLQIAYALRKIACDVQHKFTGPDLFVLAQAIDRLGRYAPTSSEQTHHEYVVDQLDKLGLVHRER